MVKFPLRALTRFTYFTAVYVLNIFGRHGRLVLMNKIVVTRSKHAKLPIDFIYDTYYRASNRIWKCRVGYCFIIYIYLCIKRVLLTYASYTSYSSYTI